MLAPVRWFVVLMAVWTMPLPVWGKGPEEAVQRLEESLKKLEPCEKNGRARARLYERMGAAWKSGSKEKEAVSAYRQALDAYATAGDEKARDRLLKRLSKPGKNWSKRSASLFVRTEKAWKQLGELQKKVKKLPRRDRPVEDPDIAYLELMQSVIDLGKLAQKLQDKWLLASSAQLEGMLFGSQGQVAEEIAKIREAAETCAKAFCPAKRRELLAEAAALLEKSGDLVEAYKTLAVLNSEQGSSLTEERRLYARSRELDRVCGLLRAGKDPTVCIQLERKSAGYATFKDFSSGPERPKLPQDEVKQVHELFLPLLNECLYRAAKSGEADPGEKYELHWAIKNDGQTDRFECYPSLEGLELDRCFKDALRLFRYPRYKGERQTVTVPLFVNQ